MEITLSKAVFALLAAACFSTRAYSASYTVDTANPADFEIINQAIFRPITAGSGSGTFTRLFAFSDTNKDGNTTDEGYNYHGNGTLPFDQNTGGFEAKLDLGDVPVATIDGTQYLQFLFDSSKTRKLLEFRLFLKSDPSDQNISPEVNSEIQVYQAINNPLGTLIYNFDGDGQDNDLTMTMLPGNGKGDLSFNVPISLLPGSAKTKDNLYAWIKLEGASGSFSEFAIGKNPTLPLYSSLVPEPGTVGGGLTILALAGSGMIRRRHCRTRRIASTKA